MKICTFNIRLDVEADKEHSFKYRRDEITNIINKNDFDVIGMQECLPTQNKFLQDNLNNYKSVLQYRDESGNWAESCTIFYKSKKFELKSSGTFWLSETPDVPFTRGWDSACTRVCTYVELKNMITGENIFVFNTHFDHEGINAINKSAKLLKQRVKDIAGEHLAFVVGDFNLTPDNKVYLELTEQENAFIDSRINATQIKGGKFSYHDYGNYKMLIDYIFTNKKVDILYQEIIENNKASDHYPVYIETSPAKL